jgi:hypothetical protein
VNCGIFQSSFCARSVFALVLWLRKHVGNFKCRHVLASLLLRPLISKCRRSWILSGSVWQHCQPRPKTCGCRFSRHSRLRPSSWNRHFRRRSPSWRWGRQPQGWGEAVSSELLLNNPGDICLVGEYFMLVGGTLPGPNLRFYSLADTYVPATHTPTRGCQQASGAPAPPLPLPGKPSHGSGDAGRAAAQGQEG